MRECLLYFRVPMRLVSEANARDNRWKAAARAKSQKETVGWKLLETRIPAKRVTTRCPLHVTITRCGKKRMDSDNNARSAKAVRDALATWLGIDDGDEDRVTYEVLQEVGPKEDYAIEVRIWTRPEKEGATP